MADQDKLEKLSDQTGATHPDPTGKTPDASPPDQSDSTETSTETTGADTTSVDDSAAQKTTASDPMDADWEPLTLYLLEDVHREFNKPFFMRLQLEHPELQEYMKRELQQAALEVAMRYEDDVVERAQNIHGTLDEDGEKEGDSWEPLTVYLLEDVHREFNKPFFMRLQLEHPELQEYMKRELQQAAAEVAMEHGDEVATRAKELHGDLTQ